MSRQSNLVLLIVLLFVTQFGGSSFSLGPMMQTIRSHSDNLLGLLFTPFSTTCDLNILQVSHKIFEPSLEQQTTTTFKSNLEFCAATKTNQFYSSTLLTLPTSSTMASIIAGISFDPTTTIATPIVHGYDKAQRDALTPDSFVKVYDAAVKSNLPDKLTKGLQVTSFHPTEMKDKDNFFVFVSNWQTTVLSIESHLRTFYMETAFVHIQVVRTVPDEVDMAVYTHGLVAYAGLIATHRVDHAQYMIDLAAHPAAVAAATAAGIAPPAAPAEPVEPPRPIMPTGTSNLANGAGSILHIWHSLTLEQVVASVKAQYDHVADATHRQNLAWSFKYIMSLCDFDLQHYVLSVLSSLPQEIAHTGPVAYYVIAKRILQTSENLSQNVINGFIAMRLTHFDSENVVECVFTLRNVLKFLRYGEVDSFAPRTTMKLLFQVLQGTSVSTFRTYVQGLEDFHRNIATEPEELFNLAQAKYEELLTGQRWVQTTKKGSAFQLGGMKHSPYASTDEKQQVPHDSSPADNPKPKPTHDRSGRFIDRTPPKQGEDPERVRSDGETEYWCSKCNRWGSHNADNHDQWFIDFKKSMQAKKRKDKRNDATDESSGTNTPEQATGRATYAGAARGLRFSPDADLVDGISLE